MQSHFLLHPFHTLEASPYILLSGDGCQGAVPSPVHPGRFYSRVQQRQRAHLLLQVLSLYLSLHPGHQVAHEESPPPRLHVPLLLHVHQQQVRHTAMLFFFSLRLFFTFISSSSSPCPSATPLSSATFSFVILFLLLCLFSFVIAFFFLSSSPHSPLPFPEHLWIWQEHTHT